VESRLEIVAGSAVGTFIARVQQRPDQYREVVVCSPFLDDATRPWVVDFAQRAPRVRCGFRVITRKEAADALFGVLPGGRKVWKRVIVSHCLLHAKVYLAVARNYALSEAIVTSANFTMDGISENEELGLRITGRSETGRQLLGGLHRAIQNLMH
jgi:phosphatidylserine/phosphatidylglycerophosphate/cardiolipin synthase-like enzyme